MCAYLAIFKDSFREALHSRVLWILLCVFTLVLLALAPVHIDQATNWELRPQEVEFLGTRLRDASETAGTPAAYIWGQLDEKTKTKIEEFNPREHPPWEGHIHKPLNKLLTKTDFYDEATWSEVTLSREARVLLEDKQAGEEVDTMQLNRRLLESAFPIIPKCEGAAYRFGYLRWTSPTLATNARQFRTAVNFIVTGLISLIVGGAGVFVGILVTSSMIPGTFAAGSVDLLLSKPITRVGLFLTKFAGGCVFVLLNAAYLLVGLWLISGLRLGIWTDRILWCIPVFLFLFSIYYAVSAMAGLVWKNAIVCVVISICFWMMCKFLGVGQEFLRGTTIVPNQFIELTIAGDELLAMNGQGESVRWEASTASWKTVFNARKPSRTAGDKLVGPIYDAQNKRIIGIPVEFNPMGRSNVGDYLVIGKPDDDWKRVRGAQVPDGARGIFLDGDGAVIVVCPGNVYRLSGDIEKAPREKGDNRLKIAGIRLPISFPSVNRLGARKIGPQPWPADITFSFSVAHDSQTDQLAFYDKGKVLVFGRDEDDGYTRRELELNLAHKNDGQVAMAGGNLLVADTTGRLTVLGVSQDKVLAELQPFEQRPEKIVTSPDGNWFAVIFHDHCLAILNSQTGELAANRLPSQGKITTATFNHANQVVVADAKQRVIEFDLQTGRRSITHHTKLSLAQRVYHYGFDPAYRLFPKPSHLDSLIGYLLLNDDDNGSAGAGLSFILQMARGVQQQLTPSDIWNTIWSNLAFVVVVLLCGSVYVWRKEF